MTYAQVTGSTITTVTGTLPNAARRLDTGEWVMGLPNAPIALRQACGWFEVVEVAKPADTATDTYTRDVQLVAGTPTVVWTQVAKSAAQLESDRVNTAQTTLRSEARTAYTNNVAYIAIASPTNAQVAAQVKDLTRQVNAIIRLVVAQDLI